MFRDGWIVHFIEPDCRTPLKPGAFLRRCHLLARANATPEAFAEFDHNVRAWSRGGRDVWEVRSSLAQPNAAPARHFGRRTPTPKCGNLPRRGEASHECNYRSVRAKCRRALGAGKGGAHAEGKLPSGTRRTGASPPTRQDPERAAAQAEEILLWLARKVRPRTHGRRDR